MLFGIFVLTVGVILFLVGITVGNLLDRYIPDCVLVTIIIISVILVISGGVLDCCDEINEGCKTEVTIVEIGGCNSHKCGVKLSNDEFYSVTNPVKGQKICYTKIISKRHINLKTLKVSRIPEEETIR